jgi:hypothetical protein
MAILSTITGFQLYAAIFHGYKFKNLYRYNVGGWMFSMDMNARGTAEPESS